MSDLNSLNDLELTHLEQYLTGVKLAPTSRQRERLLYSCGHAAGRAELRGRVRLMSAATGMLVCLSAGLSFLLLADTSPGTNVVDGTGAAPAESERTDSRTDQVTGEPQLSDQNRRWQLSAGTSVDEWLIGESRQTTGPQIATPPGVPSTRVLTAASRWWADELWE